MAEVTNTQEEQKVVDYAALIPEELPLDLEDEYMDIVYKYQKQDNKRNLQVSMQEAAKKFEEGGMVEVRKMVVVVSEGDDKRIKLTEDITNMILEAVFCHPGLGVDKLHDRIMDNLFSDIIISKGNIKSVFHNHDLKKFKDRQAWLKEQLEKRQQKATPEQQKVLDGKKTKSSEGEESWIIYDLTDTDNVGELCTQDTVNTGKWSNLPLLEGKKQKRVYQQTFIDFNSMFIIAEVGRQRTAKWAGKFLTTTVLPTFQEHGHKPSKIITDKATEYFSETDENHFFRLRMKIKGIEHKPIQEEGSHQNKVAKKVHDYMMKHFYSKIPHNDINTLEEIQERLDAWLADFNSKQSPFVKEPLIPSEVFKRTGGV